MAAGGWKTPAMFRRYAIVSSADQRAAVEKLERARAANSPKIALIFQVLCEGPRVDRGYVAHVQRAFENAVGIRTLRTYRSLQAD